MRKTLPHASYLILVAAAVLTSSGCRMTVKDFKLVPKNNPRSQVKLYDDIAHVSVWAKTPLVDYDSDQVPDGVLVHVYLRRAAQAKPVAGNGAMVFRLIRRTKDPDGRPIDEELKAWTLSAEDLPRALGHDRFGLLVYRMELYWRNLRVRGPGIHMIGEFIRPDGQVVRSTILPLGIRGAPVSAER